MVNVNAAVALVGVVAAAMLLTMAVSTPPVNASVPPPECCGSSHGGECDGHCDCEVTVGGHCYTMCQCPWAKSPNGICRVYGTYDQEQLRRWDQERPGSPPRDQ